MRCVVAARVVSSSLPLHVCTCLCCHVQDGWLPLHVAAMKNKSEAMIKAVLDAYPDAAKAKDKQGKWPKTFARTDAIKALLE